MRSFAIDAASEIAVLAAAIGGVFYFGSRQTAHRLTEKDSIVLAEFTNTTGDPVFDGVSGGEHQHRRPAPLASQRSERLEAVHARQTHVEHDRVVLRSGAHPNRVLARSRHVGRVAVVPETTHEQTRHLQLVLDHENLHCERNRRSRTLELG